ncbi:MAG: hypothetical protein HY852_16345 [Bradyrhizobium sp.]|uniref:hypothetical protein n=1 Tax=Bradyrhizobium sp. TaxID=376 RepID=UPI0025C66E06|nr:hypothetical protein [Bradyrhizobium sp.]MBI5263380.1 hypothetical protein [Bradyrhizobium sp.]
MLPLIAGAVGIYLGLHFNVFILLPATLLGGGAVVASSLVAGESLIDSAVATVLPIIFCQAGYMMGLTAREAYAQLLARLNLGQSRQV